MLSTMQDSALAELGKWYAALNQPENWYQLAVLLLALLGAWFAHRLLDARLGGRVDEAEATGLRRFTLRSAQRVLLPLSMLLAVLVGRAILDALDVNTAVLGLAVPLLMSLAAIRLVIYALRKGFTVTPALKAWENIVSTSIWAVLALHLLGWLPEVSAAFDALAFNLGETRISLLSVLKLILAVALLMTLAFWLAGVIDRHMKASPHINPGMQVAFGKFSRFFLVTLAVLLSLNAVGIDLTALAVFGGALGVGLGFGLQRIASNFISGFILVLDRSIKPGDVITVGQSFGWVQELRARYVVVRSRDGVETLIPNENLITSEVINWSYTDPNVRVRIKVQISYDDDPEQAMAVMLEAAQASDRVLADPPPAVRLIEFADSGIVLELRVWIPDPESGVGTVRSSINLAIWRAFKQAGITIPYPQRDIHIKSQPAD
jgi:small-conductance mechanosensitive channel